jgi:TRAP-type C4-dicarboxylate transport system substrate-binding protein
MSAALHEIISVVRDGGRPDYEDLRYAICALDALAVFNRSAFMKLAEAEREGRKPFMTSSAQWQWEEHYRREQTALGKPPKEYVGWNNDPDNPEFLARRKRAQAFMQKFEAASGSAP